MEKDTSWKHQKKAGVATVTSKQRKLPNRDKRVSLAQNIAPGNVYAPKNRAESKKKKKKNKERIKTEYKNINLKKYMHLYVHCSITYNNHDVEAT